VTRKITRAVAHIQAGLQDKLYLGNLDAKRDWGYAKEYVEAMWLMLQQEKGDDYVIATHETHSIREFLDAAFGRVGLDWRRYVEIDPRYYRPAEVDLLMGDNSKAKRLLGWEPKTRFADLVKLMVDADIELLRRHREGKTKLSG
jgi:GDPmannose 4,6-dehydratase